ncbi:MAG: hypothetical protein J5858_06930 [Lentisphaeria bacterium]|nr:hypothetical protein [Lentisphaeria bacterium]
MKASIFFVILISGALTVFGADKPAIKDGVNVFDKGPIEIKAEQMRQGMTEEPLSITAGEKRVINLPFAIESCKSNSSNVKIETVSGNMFEILGVAPGKAVLTVVAGGIEKQFNVTVFNSTLQTYQELGRLLEEIPEVTLELRDDGLSLRGVIVQPVHWSIFRRILAPFADRCHNYVSFQPDAKLIESLKKQLENAGFPVTKQALPQVPGQLAFNLSGSILMVSGSLLSEQSIQKVKKILASNEWLNPEWNGNNFRVDTDLTVAPSQIDLGIVFVGVTRNQLERLGNSSANGVVASWDVIGWFKALYGGSPDEFSNHGDQHVGGSTLLQSNLKGSLMFLGDNGISDFRDAGHITLTNASKEDSSFENGGTRSVMVYGRDTADLKEINFGLKYKARALLLENNMVKLNLDLERSLPPVKVDNDYVQRKSKTKTELLCPLGKTAVIARQKELTFNKHGPVGYAFLRHVPILNWFFSFKEDSGEQVQILILVSPELMHQNVKMSSRPSKDTSPLEQEVSTRVNSENGKVIKNENRSWFTRMFTW